MSNAIGNPTDSTLNRLWSRLKELGGVGASTALEPSPRHQQEKDIDTASFATLHFPHAAFTDPELRYKLIEFIKTKTSQVNPPYPFQSVKNIETIVDFIHQGLRIANPENDHVIYSFLGDLPHVPQEELELSSSEINMIQDAKERYGNPPLLADILDSVSDQNTENWLSQTKVFQSDLARTLNISPTELKFRRQAHLFEPNNPLLYRLARSLSKQDIFNPNDSAESIAASVLNYVQTEFDYKKEMGKDHWQSIDETLTSKTGDCEDLALLCGSLLTHILIHHKGLDAADVHKMVKLSVGNLSIPSTNQAVKTGHAFVLFNPNPDHSKQGLVLDATSSLSPFSLSKLDYEALFEFNASSFTVFKDIDPNFFTTANFEVLLNDNRAFGMERYEIVNGVKVEREDYTKERARLLKKGIAFDDAIQKLAYEANKDTLLWKINDSIRTLNSLISKPIEVPLLHKGALYKKGIANIKRHSSDPQEKDKWSTESWIDLNTINNTSFNRIITYFSALTDTKTNKKETAITFSFEESINIDLPETNKTFEIRIDKTFTSEKAFSDAYLEQSNKIDKEIQTIRSYQAYIDNTKEQQRISEESAALSEEKNAFLRGLGLELSATVDDIDNEGKKAIFRNFTRREESLETQKKQIEEALAPYDKAIKQLNEMQTNLTTRFTDSLPETPTDGSFPFPVRFIRTTSKQEASDNRSLKGKKVSINGFSSLVRELSRKRAIDTQIRETQTKLEAFQSKLATLPKGSSDIEIKTQISLLKESIKRLKNQRFDIYQLAEVPKDDYTKSYTSDSTYPDGKTANYSFNFFDVHSKTLHFDTDTEALNFGKKYGGNANDANISQELQSIRINERKLYDYAMDVKRQLNTTAALINIAQGFFDTKTQVSRDIGDEDRDQDTLEALNKIRQDADKHAEKAIGNFDSLQNKVNEGIQEITRETFSFVQSANDAIFKKKELDIETWARASSEELSPGSFVSSLIGGGSSELADGLTGALSYMRSKRKEEIHQEQARVAIFNTNAYVNYARLTLEGREKDGELIDGIQIGDTYDGLTKDIVFKPGFDLLAESDDTKPKKAYDNFSKQFFLNYLSGLSSTPLNQTSKDPDSTIAGGEGDFNILMNNIMAGFDSFRPGSLSQIASGDDFKFSIDVNNLQNSSIMHRTKGFSTGKFGGSGLTHTTTASSAAISSGGTAFDAVFKLFGVKKVIDDRQEDIKNNGPDITAVPLGTDLFLDYNMEKAAYLRERETQFEAVLYAAYKAKIAILEAKVEAAQSFSDSKSTAISSQISKIAEKALTTELGQLQKSFDMIHQQSMSVISHTNTLVNTRIDYYLNSVEMDLKVGQLLSQIASYMVAKGLGHTLSGPIVAGATTYNTALAAAAVAPDPASKAASLAIVAANSHYKLFESMGLANPDYWEYAFSAVFAAITEASISDQRLALYNAIPGYQFHHTMQNNDSDFFDHNKDDITRNYPSSNANTSFPFTNEGTLDAIQSKTGQRKAYSSSNPEIAIKADLGSIFGSKTEEDVDNYFSTLSTQVLLSPRLQFNQLAQKDFSIGGEKNYNLPFVPIVAGENKAGASFIESRGDGFFVYNGLLGAQKAPLFLQYKNIIKVHLMIIKAYADTLASIVAYMFNQKKSNGYQLLEGINAIEKFIGNEANIISDLKQEINFLIEGWNASAARDQKRYHLHLKRRSNFIGIGTSLLSFVPYGIGQGLHTFGDLITESAESIVRLGTGHFAGLHSNYWKEDTVAERMHSISKLQEEWVGDKDRYNAGDSPKKASLFKEGKPNDYRLKDISQYAENAGNETYLQSGFAKAVGPYPSQKDQTRDPSLLNKYERRVSRLRPWYELEEREKDLFHLVSHSVNSGGKARQFLDKESGQYKRSGHQFIGIGKQSSALEFKQVEFEEMAVIQDELNKIHMIRSLLISIQKARYNAIQAILKETFGVSSSVDPFDTMTSILDDYNSVQFETLNEIAQELSSRVESENIYRQAQIDTGIEGATLGLLIKLGYSSFRSSLTSRGKNYPNFGVRAMQQASTASLAKTFANLVVTILAFIGIRDKPQVNLVLIEESDATTDSSTDNPHQRNEKTDTENKNQEESKKAEDRLQKKIEDDFNEIDSFNADNQFDNSHIKFSSRGKFAVNRAALSKRLTKLKQRFRKIQLQAEILVSIQESKLEAASDIGGGSSYQNSARGLLSMISKLNQTQQQIVQSQFSSLENVAKARNQAMDRLKQTGAEFIKSAIQGLTAFFSGKTKQSAEKNKLQSGTGNKDISLDLFGGNAYIGFRLLNSGLKVFESLAPLLGMMAFDGLIDLANHIAKFGDENYIESAGDAAFEDGDDSGEGSDSGLEFASTADLENVALDAKIAVGNIAIRRIILDEIKEFLNATQGVIKSGFKSLRDFVSHHLVDKPQQERLDKEKEKLEASELKLDELEKSGDLARSGLSHLVNPSETPSLEDFSKLFFGQRIGGAIGVVSNSISSLFSPDPETAAAFSAFGRKTANFFQPGVTVAKSVLDLVNTLLDIPTFLLGLITPANLFVNEQTFNEAQDNLSSFGHFKENMRQLSIDFGITKSDAELKQENNQMGQDLKQLSADIQDTEKIVQEQKQESDVLKKELEALKNKPNNAENAKKILELNSKLRELNGDNTGFLGLAQQSQKKLDDQKRLKDLLEKEKAFSDATLSINTLTKENQDNSEQQKRFQEQLDTLEKEKSEDNKETIALLKDAIKKLDEETKKNEDTIKINETIIKDKKTSTTDDEKKTMETLKKELLNPSLGIQKKRRELLLQKDDLQTTLTDLRLKRDRIATQGGLTDEERNEAEKKADDEIQDHVDKTNEIKKELRDLKLLQDYHNSPYVKSALSFEEFKAHHNRDFLNSYNEKGIQNKYDPSASSFVSNQVNPNSEDEQLRRAEHNQKRREIRQEQEARLFRRIEHLSSDDADLVDKFYDTDASLTQLEQTLKLQRQLDFVIENTAHFKGEKSTQLRQKALDLNKKIKNRTRDDGTLSLNDIRVFVSDFEALQDDKAVNPILAEFDKADFEESTQFLDLLNKGSTSERESSTALASSLSGSLLQFQLVFFQKHSDRLSDTTRKELLAPNDKNIKTITADKAEEHITNRLANIHKGDLTFHAPGKPLSSSITHFEEQLKLLNLDATANKEKIDLLTQRKSILESIQTKQAEKGKDLLKDFSNKLVSGSILDDTHTPIFSSSNQEALRVDLVFRLQSANPLFNKLEAKNLEGTLTNIQNRLHFTGDEDGKALKSRNQSLKDLLLTDIKVASRLNFLVENGRTQEAAALLFELVQLGDVTRASAVNALARLRESNPDTFNTLTNGLKSHGESLDRGKASRSNSMLIRDFLKEVRQTHDGTKRILDALPELNTYSGTYNIFSSQYGANKEAIQLLTDYKSGTTFFSTTTLSKGLSFLNLNFLDNSDRAVLNNEHFLTTEQADIINSPERFSKLILELETTDPELQFLLEQQSQGQFNALISHLVNQSQGDASNPDTLDAQFVLKKIGSLGKTASVIQDKINASSSTEQILSATKKTVTELATTGINLSTEKDKTILKLKGGGTTVALVDGASGHDLRTVTQGLEKSQEIGLQDKIISELKDSKAQLSFLIQDAIKRGDFTGINAFFKALDQLETVSGEAAKIKQDIIDLLPDKAIESINKRSDATFARVVPEGDSTDDTLFRQAEHRDRFVRKSERLLDKLENQNILKDIALESQDRHDTKEEQEQAQENTTAFIRSLSKFTAHGIVIGTEASEQSAAKIVALVAKEFKDNQELLNLYIDELKREEERLIAQLPHERQLLKGEEFINALKSNNSDLTEDQYKKLETGFQNTAYTQIPGVNPPYLSSKEVINRSLNYTKIAAVTTEQILDHALTKPEHKRDFTTSLDAVETTFGTNREEPQLGINRFESQHTLNAQLRNRALLFGNMSSLISKNVYSDRKLQNLHAFFTGVQQDIGVAFGQIDKDETTMDQTMKLDSTEVLRLKTEAQSELKSLEDNHGLLEAEVLDRQERLTAMMHLCDMYLNCEDTLTLIRDQQNDLDDSADYTMSFTALQESVDDARKRYQAMQRALKELISGKKSLKEFKDLFKDPKSISHVTLERIQNLSMQSIQGLETHLDAVMTEINQTDQALHELEDYHTRIEKLNKLADNKKLTHATGTLRAIHASEHSDLFGPNVSRLLHYLDRKFSGIKEDPSISLRRAVADEGATEWDLRQVFIDTVENKLRTHLKTHSKWAAIETAINDYNKQLDTGLFRKDLLAFEALKTAISNLLTEPLTQEDHALFTQFKQDQKLILELKLLSEMHTIHIGENTEAPDFLSSGGLNRETGEQLRSYQLTPTDSDKLQKLRSEYTLRFGTARDMKQVLQDTRADHVNNLATIIKDAVANQDFEPLAKLLSYRDFLDNLHNTQLHATDTELKNAFSTFDQVINTLDKNIETIPIDLNTKTGQTLKPILSSYWNRKLDALSGLIQDPKSYLDTLSKDDTNRTEAEKHDIQEKREDLFNLIKNENLVLAKKFKNNAPLTEDETATIQTIFKQKVILGYLDTLHNNYKEDSPLELTLSDTFKTELGFTSQEAETIKTSQDLFTNTALLEKKFGRLGEKFTAFLNDKVKPFNDAKATLLHHLDTNNTAALKTALTKHPKLIHHITDKRHYTQLLLFLNENPTLLTNAPEHPHDASELSQELTPQLKTDLSRFKTGKAKQLLRLLSTDPSDPNAIQNLFFLSSISDPDRARLLELMPNPDTLISDKNHDISPHLFEGAGFTKTESEQIYLALQQPLVDPFGLRPAGVIINDQNQISHFFQAEKEGSDAYTNKLVTHVITTTPALGSKETLLKQTLFTTLKKAYDQKDKRLTQLRKLSHHITHNNTLLLADKQALLEKLDTIIEKQDRAQTADFMQMRQESRRISKKLAKGQYTVTSQLHRIGGLLLTHKEDILLHLNHKNPSMAEKFDTLLSPNTTMPEHAANLLHVLDSLSDFGDPTIATYIKETRRHLSQAVFQLDFEGKTPFTDPQLRQSFHEAMINKTYDFADGLSPAQRVLQGQGMSRPDKLNHLLSLSSDTSTQARYLHQALFPNLSDANTTDENIRLREEAILPVLKNITYITIPDTTLIHLLSAQMPGQSDEDYQAYLISLYSQLGQDNRQEIGTDIPLLDNKDALQAQVLNTILTKFPSFNQFNNLSINPSAINQETLGDIMLVLQQDGFSPNELFKATRLVQSLNPEALENFKSHWSPTLSERAKEELFSPLEDDRDLGDYLSTLQVIESDNDNPDTIQTEKQTIFDNTFVQEGTSFLEKKADIIHLFDNLKGSKDADRFDEQVGLLLQCSKLEEPEKADILIDFLSTSANNPFVKSRLQNSRLAKDFSRLIVSQFQSLERFTPEVQQFLLHTPYFKEEVFSTVSSLSNTTNVDSLKNSSFMLYAMLSFNKFERIDMDDETFNKIQTDIHQDTFYTIFDKINRKDEFFITLLDIAAKDGGLQNPILTRFLDRQGNLLRRYFQETSRIEASTSMALHRIKLIGQLEPKLIEKLFLDAIEHSEEDPIDIDRLFELTFRNPDFLNHLDEDRLPTIRHLIQRIIGHLPPEIERLKTENETLQKQIEDNAVDETRKDELREKIQNNTEKISFYEDRHENSILAFRRLLDPAPDTSIFKAKAPKLVRVQVADLLSSKENTGSVGFNKLIMATRYGGYVPKENIIKLKLTDPNAPNQMRIPDHPEKIISQLAKLGREKPALYEKLMTENTIQQFIKAVDFANKEPELTEAFSELNRSTSYARSLGFFTQAPSQSDQSENRVVSTVKTSGQSEEKAASAVKTLASATQYSKTKWSQDLKHDPMFKESVLNHLNGELAKNLLNKTTPTMIHTRLFEQGDSDPLIGQLFYDAPEELKARLSRNLLNTLKGSLSGKDKPDLSDPNIRSTFLKNIAILATHSSLSKEQIFKEIGEELVRSGHSTPTFIQDVFTSRTLDSTSKKALLNSLLQTTPPKEKGTSRSFVFGRVQSGPQQSLDTLTTLYKAKQPLSASDKALFSTLLVDTLKHFKSKIETQQPAIRAQLAQLVAMDINDTGDILTQVSTELDPTLMSLLANAIVDTLRNEPLRLDPNWKLVNPMSRLVSLFKRTLSPEHNHVTSGKPATESMAKLLGLTLTKAIQSQIPVTELYPLLNPSETLPPFTYQGTIADHYMVLKENGYLDSHTVIKRQPQDVLPEDLVSIFDGNIDTATHVHEVLHQKGALENNKVAIDLNDPEANNALRLPTINDAAGYFVDLQGYGDIEEDDFEALYRSVLFEMGGIDLDGTLTLSAIENKETEFLNKLEATLSDHKPPGPTAEEKQHNMAILSDYYREICNTAQEQSNFLSEFKLTITQYRKLREFGRKMVNDARTFQTDLENALDEARHKSDPETLNKLQEELNQYYADSNERFIQARPQDQARKDLLALETQFHLRKGTLLHLFHSQNLLDKHMLYIFPDTLLDLHSLTGLSPSDKAKLEKEIHTLASRIRAHDLSSLKTVLTANHHILSPGPLHSNRGFDSPYLESGLKDNLLLPFISSSKDSAFMRHVLESSLDNNEALDHLFEQRTEQSLDLLYDPYLSTGAKTAWLKRYANTEISGYQTTRQKQTSNHILNRLVKSAPKTKAGERMLQENLSSFQTHNPKAFRDWARALPKDTADRPGGMTQAQLALFGLDFIHSTALEAEILDMYAAFKQERRDGARPTAFEDQLAGKMIAAAGPDSPFYGVGAVELFSTVQSLEDRGLLSDHSAPSQGKTSVSKQLAKAAPFKNKDSVIKTLFMTKEPRPPLSLDPFSPLADRLPNQEQEKKFIQHYRFQVQDLRQKLMESLSSDPVNLESQANEDLSARLTKDNQAFIYDFLVLDKNSDPKLDEERLAELVGGKEHVSDRLREELETVMHVHHLFNTKTPSSESEKEQVKHSLTVLFSSDWDKLIVQTSNPLRRAVNLVKTAGIYDPFLSKFNNHIQALYPGSRKLNYIGLPTKTPDKKIIEADPKTFTYTKDEQEQKKDAIKESLDRFQNSHQENRLETLLSELSHLST